jgi:3-oxoacyl-[acyl-carrier protein] reductase
MGGRHRTQEGWMNLGLTEATAIVSGGSKGMGRAAALAMAAEGARVAVLARGKGPLAQTAAELLAAA